MHHRQKIPPVCVAGQQMLGHMNGVFRGYILRLYTHLPRTFAGRRRGEAPLDAPRRAMVRPPAAPPDSLGRDHVELVPRLLMLVVLLSFPPGSLSSVLALKGVRSGYSPRR